MTVGVTGSPQPPGPLAWAARLSRSPEPLAWPLAWAARLGCSPGPLAWAARLGRSPGPFAWVARQGRVGRLSRLSRSQEAIWLAFTWQCLALAGSIWVPTTALTTATTNRLAKKISLSLSTQRASFMLLRCAVMFPHASNLVYIYIYIYILIGFADCRPV